MFTLLEGINACLKPPHITPGKQQFRCVSATLSKASLVASYR